MKKTTNPENVRSWYIANFPDDELGMEIKPRTTFTKLYQESKKSGADTFYRLTVDDSVIRERIFEEISKRNNETYEAVYNNIFYFDKEKSVFEVGKKYYYRFITDSSHWFYDVYEIVKRTAKTLLIRDGNGNLFRRKIDDNGKEEGFAVYGAYICSSCEYKPQMEM